MPATPSPTHSAWPFCDPPNATPATPNTVRAVPVPAQPVDAAAIEDLTTQLNQWVTTDTPLPQLTLTAPPGFAELTDAITAALTQVQYEERAHLGKAVANAVAAERRRVAGYLSDIVIRHQPLSPFTTTGRQS